MRLTLSLTMLITFIGSARVQAEESTARNPMALQVALEREGFSPGLLDGKVGAKTTMALKDFQRAHSLPVTGLADDETAAALNLDDSDGTTEYTIAQEDADLVTGPIPKSWNDKAAMELLGYPDLAEAIAERFHTKVETLERLNPGMTAHLHVGEKLIVPAAEVKDLPHVGSLLVNLSEKTIRAYDAGGKQIALFHCSIAKDKAKRPDGEAHVVVVAMNPNYTFDPAMWSDVHDVTKKLTIPPGPRNPVGMAWVGLSLPGYGIHGTPAPAMIGKTGSHGCFRMTNWDAIKLAKAIRVGVPVRFVGKGD